MDAVLMLCTILQMIVAALLGAVLARYTVRRGPPGPPGAAGAVGMVGDAGQCRCPA